MSISECQNKSRPAFSEASPSLQDSNSSGKRYKKAYPSKFKSSKSPTRKSTVQKTKRNKKSIFIRIQNIQQKSWDSKNHIEPPSNISKNCLTPQPQSKKRIKLFDTPASRQSLISQIEGFQDNQFYDPYQNVKSHIRVQSRHSSYFSNASIKSSLEKLEKQKKSSFNLQNLQKEEKKQENFALKNVQNVKSIFQQKKQKDQKKKTLFDSITQNCRFMQQLTNNDVLNMLTIEKQQKIYQTTAIANGDVILYTINKNQFIKMQMSFTAAKVNHWEQVIYKAFPQLQNENKQNKKAVIKLWEKAQFERGQIITREGVQGNKIYICMQGSIVFLKQNEYSYQTNLFKEDIQLFQVNGLRVFGEEILFPKQFYEKDNNLYYYTVKCLTDVTVLQADAHQFYEICPKKTKLELLDFIKICKKYNDKLLTTAKSTHRDKIPEQNSFIEGKAKLQQYNQNTMTKSASQHLNRQQFSILQKQQDEIPNLQAEEQCFFEKNIYQHRNNFVQNAKLHQIINVKLKMKENQNKKNYLTNEYLKLKNLGLKNEIQLNDLYKSPKDIYQDQEINYLVSVKKNNKKDEISIDKQFQNYLQQQKQSILIAQQIQPNKGKIYNQFSKYQKRKFSLNKNFTKEVIHKSQSQNRTYIQDVKNIQQGIYNKFYNKIKTMRNKSDRLITNFRRKGGTTNQNFCNNNNIIFSQEKFFTPKQKESKDADFITEFSNSYIKQSHQVKSNKNVHLLQNLKQSQFICQDKNLQDKFSERLQFIKDNFHLRKSQNKQPFTQMETQKQQSIMKDSEKRPDIINKYLFRKKIPKCNYLGHQVMLI